MLLSVFKNAGYWSYCTSMRSRFPIPSPSLSKGKVPLFTNNFSKIYIIDTHIFNRDSLNNYRLPFEKLVKFRCLLRAEYTGKKFGQIILHNIIFKSRME